MRSRTLLAVVVVAAACASVPRPRFPQVEQAVQATHGGGERYRSHERCAEVARTVEDLVACMKQEGYDFIVRGTDYPAPECWSARDSGTDVSSIPPHCFEHAAGTSH
jgi:hypothetical protein